MKTNFSIGIPIWLDKILAWPIIFYRLLRYEHPYRKIPLGQNFFALVDPADYYWLNSFHWSARRNGNCVYAVRFLNETGRKNKIISMHREIFFRSAAQTSQSFPKEKISEKFYCEAYFLGNSKCNASNVLIDHRNNITLDNRRFNLRAATHSQNQYNKAKTKSKTSSRFIGVYKEKNTDYWCSKISRKGKSIWLGRFDSEIVAAKAYDVAAKKYHAEFARLNFPEVSS